MSKYWLSLLIIPAGLILGFWAGNNRVQDMQFKRTYVGKVQKYDILLEDGLLTGRERLKVYSDSGVYLANEKYSPRYGDSVFVKVHGFNQFLCFQGGECVSMSGN